MFEWILSGGKEIETSHRLESIISIVKNAQVSPSFFGISSSEEYIIIKEDDEKTPKWPTSSLRNAIALLMRWSENHEFSTYDCEEHYSSLIDEALKVLENNRNLIRNQTNGNNLESLEDPERIEGTISRATLIALYYRLSNMREKRSSHGDSKLADIDLGRVKELMKLIENEFNEVI